MKKARRLNVGILLDNNLTKRNLEKKKIGIIIRSSSKSKLKIFFKAIFRIKQANLIFGTHLIINLTRRNLEKKAGIMLRSTTKS